MMKSSVYMFVLWIFLCVKVAVAIPVPLGVDVNHRWTLASAIGRVRAGISKDEAIQNVKTAGADANKQIEAMERVLQNPSHPNRHLILQESFGENYHKHMPEIEKGVQELKNGNIRVTNVFENKGRYGGAYVNTAGTRVHTGVNFHRKLGSQGRAGVIIHEASHALLATEDHHVMSKSAGKLKDVSPDMASRYPRKDVRMGYAWHEDYKHVINNHRNPTKNADSWSTFGFHARHGFDPKHPYSKIYESSTSFHSTGSHNQYHNPPSGSGSHNQPHNAPSGSRGGGGGHGHSLASVAAAIHPGTARHLAPPKRH